MRESRGVGRTLVFCPSDGRRGRSVPSATVRGLVDLDPLIPIEEHEWFFCESPGCDVVYFTGNGRLIRKAVLRTRVGLKETEAPRPVCYCFGHTVESIREEIERTSRSTVVASVAAKVRAGECRCEQLNPRGTCCLGDLNRIVKEATAGPEDTGSDPPAVADQGGGHACCAPADNGPAKI